MSDHVVLYVDGLERHDAEVSSSGAADPTRSSDGEEQPLIQMGECRICQEEDSLQNLEMPCACSGSLKYAHRKCVQHWCNEKGDTVCEICHQQFQPNYTAPPCLTDPEDTTIDISGGWTISGTPLDLRDPRLLAIAEADHHLLDAEYEEYTNSDDNGATFYCSATLILMALLLLRHAMTILDEDGEDDDDSPYFCLSLLRAAGFLLPCYIMAWAIGILQRRRQRREAAALASRQVAFVLQAGQNLGVHFTVAPAMEPASPVAAQQEPA